MLCSVCCLLMLLSRCCPEWPFQCSEVASLQPLMPHFFKISILSFPARHGACWLAVDIRGGQFECGAVANSYCHYKNSLSIHEQPDAVEVFLFSYVQLEAKLPTSALWYGPLSWVPWVVLILRFHCIYHIIGHDVYIHRYIRLFTWRSPILCAVCVMWSLSSLLTFCKLSRNMTDTKQINKFRK